MVAVSIIIVAVSRVTVEKCTRAALDQCITSDFTRRIFSTGFSSCASSNIKASLRMTSSWEGHISFIKSSVSVRYIARSNAAPLGIIGLQLDA